MKDKEYTYTTNNLTTDGNVHIRDFLQENHKSKMIVGNLIIWNSKHFNKFHKIMWKLLLGITIEDI